MNKSILHLDLDTFFVSCERLINKELIGIPVLIGGTSDRGVVAACSYEARAYGIHSAMPMRMARQLCPHAKVIRGNSQAYSEYSNAITDIIRARSPLFEKSSIDEFYIDVTGMDRYVKTTYLWAKELREEIIHKTKLPISFGLSTSKTVAKVGTGEAKPNNHIQIETGYEKPFLAPLSIKKIPMVGNKTYHLLRRMGIERIRTVQEMPVELMERVLGKNGIVIWKKAQGIDNTPVMAWSERKSISTERTFEQDTTDVYTLKSILVGMAESLAFQLRNSNKLNQLMENHPYREGRIRQANKNIEKLLNALKEGNFNTFAEVCEEEALSLHGLMMSSSPGYTLMTPESLRAIRRIQKFREHHHVPLTYTLDAGPNIHLIYPKAQRKILEPFIREHLQPLCDNQEVINDELSID